MVMMVVNNFTAKKFNPCSSLFVWIFYRMRINSKNVSEIHWIVNHWLNFTLPKRWTSSVCNVVYLHTGNLPGTKRKKFVRNDTNSFL